jgi:hypothetical protein
MRKSAKGGMRKEKGRMRKSEKGRARSQRGQSELREVRDAS